MLLVVCGVLLNLHFIVSALMIAQWPSAYWNSSAGYSPTAQLGVVMNIAARPLPLLAYLLALWLLLPGSLDVMSGTGPGASATRRRVALGVAVTLGAALALFHLYMLFWGPLLGW